MKQSVGQAFLAVHAGYPPDRVVADPDLNGRFIRKCRQLGLKQPEAELNLRLLNLRKGGGLAGLPPGRRTTFANEAEYRYASEIAARFLEQQHGVALDRIICDPALATELDRLASELAPGFSPLQYRWAALNLRKARRLKPQLLSRVVPPTVCRLGRANKLSAEDLPLDQGLYIFYDRREKKTLYVGEAENLRKRVGKHLDHSDNRSLARWFWDHGFTEVFLEVRILSQETATRIRKALEAELISDRKPSFNVKCL